MSGRVRWVRVARILHDARQLVCGDTHCGRVNAMWSGWLGPSTLVGWYARDFRNGDARKFSRRSDAKRWLIARAAGLKEVPRRVHVGPRGGSWSYVRRDAHTVWPPPGWHEVEEYIGDDGEVGVVLCERNRRRR